MRTRFFVKAILAGCIVFLIACNQTKEDKPNVVDIAERNAETLVLMHNPMGVRAQYNINKQQLELWLSPKAKTSHSYFDRNFSNRDDHTSLFDLITLPGLDIENFIKVEYDPFFSKIIFKDQVMCIATTIDDPVFVIWFDKPQFVDIKSDKADTPVTRTANVFATRHPDRGYIFDFVAQMSKGDGRFRQSYVTDYGRSTYCRAELAANQKLVFAGGLENKNINRIAEAIAEADNEKLIKEVSSEVEALVSPGRVKLRGHEELQKLMNINRRIWYSMQDHSGAIRASIKEIYYLIWVRDGGMATSFMANAGWVEPLEKWVKFQLANPGISTENPRGRYFGQLVNPVTKWEEDGLFYAVWSAFTYWTQTGDDTYTKGKYFELFEEATNWVEQYTFDQEKGLFGRYHYCETPLKGSRGYHWDNAVGKPVSWEPDQYKGKDIVRSYDLYINMLNYAVYEMLAAMSNNDVKSAQYLEKARKLEAHMKILFPEGQMPLYGKLETIDKKIIDAGSPGLDQTDYHWALSLPYFRPAYFNTQLISDSLLHECINEPGGQFLAGYFSIMAFLDTHRCSEDKIMQAMEYAGSQCYKPGNHLPMAYSIIEMLDQEDGNPYHDIRPQPFSIGTWLGALSNMGVKRLPFGIALRSTKYIDTISGYEYQRKKLNFSFKGEGSIESIEIDGKALEYSLQIPLSRIAEKHDNNEIETVVLMSEKPSEKVLWVQSTVALNDILEIGDEVHFLIDGYGFNTIYFENTMLANIRIQDENGNDVMAEKTEENNFQRVLFRGKGNFIVKIKL